MNEFRMVDSYSDGMCGWVVAEHTPTKTVERVSWSVMGQIDSQHAAMDEAKQRLGGRP